MTRYYRNGRLTEEWARDALAAVKAHDQAMRRAKATREGRQTDLDSAALDEQIRDHMAGHPGLSYADAFDEVTRALPLIGPEQEPVRVDPDSAALDRRVMKCAVDHRLSYADAFDRVLSEL
jgi:hypothetical protein